MKTLLILFYKNVWDFKKERGIANYYLRRIMYKKKIRKQRFRARDYKLLRILNF